VAPGELGGQQPGPGASSVSTWPSSAPRSRAWPRSSAPGCSSLAGGRFEGVAVDRPGSSSMSTWPRWPRRWPWSRRCTSRAGPGRGRGAGPGHRPRARRPGDIGDIGDVIRGRRHSIEHVAQGVAGGPR
jgi:hypothetical protein